MSYGFETPKIQETASLAKRFLHEKDSHFAELIIRLFSGILPGYAR
jgi:hypothetical protein